LLRLFLTQTVRVVMAACLLMAAQARAEPGELAVRVDRLTFHAGQRPWVSVFVTVADPAGKVVGELDHVRIDVVEDGQPYSGRPVVETFVRTDRLLNYIVLVDHGEDMATSLTLVRQGLEAFFNDLGYRYPGAVVSYADYPRVIAGPIQNPHDLLMAVLALEPVSGRPRIHDGLLLGLQTLAAMEGAGRPKPDRRVLVLLTEGRDEGSMFSPEAAESGLLDSETSLFVIGYGDENQPGLKRLADLAGRSGGGYCFASYPDEIGPCLIDTAERVKRQYVVSYPSSGLEADGRAHRLTVRIRAGGRTGRGDFEFSSPDWGPPGSEIVYQILAAAGLVLLLLAYRRVRSFRYRGHWR